MKGAMEKTDPKFKKIFARFFKKIHIVVKGSKKEVVKLLLHHMSKWERFSDNLHLLVVTFKNPTSEIEEIWRELGVYIGDYVRLFGKKAK